MLFGFFTVFFALKALGGSFNSVVASLGLANYFGPLIGTLIAGLFSIFFLRFTLVPPSEQRGVQPTAIRFAIFILLVCASIAASIAVRITQLRSHPPDIKKADMIPMVLTGLKSVTEGKSPYFPRVLEDGRSQPGYYLPGLWIIYLPFYVLGIDVRIANILAQMALYVLLLDLFLRRKSYFPSFEWCALGFLFLINLVGFSKLMVSNVEVGHTATLTLTYTILLWAVAREKIVPILLFTPLFLLSREIAFLLILPYAFYLFLTNRSQFLKLAAASFVGIAIGVLPFLLASGSEFFAQTLEYHRTTHASWKVMMHYYGLLGFLRKHDLMVLQFPLQFLGIGVSLLLVHRWARSSMAAVALGGIAFLGFILFVSTTWSYLFIEPMILACFLIEMTQDPTPRCHSLRVPMFRTRTKSRS